MGNKTARASDEKFIFRAYVICSVIIIGLIIISIIWARTSSIDGIRPEYIRDISIDIVGMIICGVLIFSLGHDKPWDVQNRTLFRLIFTLCILFFLDLASSFLEGNPAAVTAIMLVNTLLFFNETLLIYCFWTYIREELKLDKKKRKPATYICRGTLICDMFMCIFNIWFGFLFTIDPNGEYIAGKYERLAEVTTFIIYLTVWVILLRAREHSIKERLILLTFLVFPACTSIIGVASNDFSTVFPMYLFSVMLIYINVFATRGKKLMEQEVTLNQQSTALMISQIQPHFIYNVLTTISNLCVTNPEEAEETTVLFSQYLRTNLDSMRKTEPVPFSAEMGHINTYVELEKKRFGDKLNVETDCRETNFLVPSLGLQPIVENSIKHGIRGKDSPGHLKISSKKVDGGYEVVIEDDGVGFDPAAPAKEDGRSHVGMINVRNRLMQMCGATMEVETSPGNGCKTTIIFPEEQ